MLKMNSKQVFYAGVSTGYFLLSILPILQLQKVLQHGSMDWVKGVCFVVSWMGFTCSAVSAYHLILLNAEICPITRIDHHSL